MATPKIGLKYRPDIDGLRAVAVLAVILYHINSSFLPGGFTGVDIFFVISGYLITGNILRESASEHGFSWVEFYRRRILRILPALFSVVFVTFLAGHFILLPEDMLELSNSALASVFSLANVYFTYYLDTSYFADDSNLQPLLHLWSLGVEEQFYIFWPIILVLIVIKLSDVKQFIFVVILAAFSFLLAESLLKSNPMFSYYMLPTRAGELLAGALLAIWLNNNKGVYLSPLLSLFIGSLGASLVIYSLIAIQENESFPGLNALPATLGAVFIILSGNNSRAGFNRFLAVKPMVLIGLISYSLYLWHWPVLAFYRYIYGDVGIVAGLILFILMLLLAFMGYRLVEKPLRRPDWSFKQTVGRVGAVGGVISCLCIAVILSKGYGFYIFNKEYVSQVDLLVPSRAAYKYDYICQRPKLSEKDLNNKYCIINGSNAVEPNVLIWGDSNASHYVGAVKVFAEKTGFSFRNVAHSSCPPILRGAKKTQLIERVDNCLASIDVVKSRLEKYNTVILAASWSDYIKNSSSFLDDLEFTVKELIDNGKKVVILGKIPRFKNIDRKCQQKKLKLGFVSCEDDKELLSREILSANNNLSSMANKFTEVEYIDFNHLICLDGLCSPYLEGGIIYFDKSHFSMEGSSVLGEAVIEREGVPAAFYNIKY